MAVYNHFAEVYARGKYPTISQAIAEILPGIQVQFGMPEKGSLLDIACGEGSFAVEMAKKGWDVVGIDQSEEMLRLARHRSMEERLTIHLLQQDMRNLVIEKQFDLATCWFDSLNYLLTTADLEKTFQNISNALKPGGWFIFDMNTIYGLAVNWQKQNCYVQQETADLLELHRTSYDYESRQASIKITWFIRDNEIWQRYEEIHVEKGYTINEIKTSLENASFSVEGCYGSLKNLTPLQLESGRVWVIAKKRKS